MPKETVSLTEREIQIMSIFVVARVLNDNKIAEELETLVKKLRS